jgi:hypothetical protein
MVARPAAVVFVNNDLTDNVQSMLVKQLHINEVVDGDTFDSRIVADPDYVSHMKQLDYRVLVKRSMEELDNRAEPDVVIFFKNGLVSILENNFGPPGGTFPVVRLTWGKLGVF